MKPAIHDHIGLKQWLAQRRQLAGSGGDAALVLGGTGHLLLSPLEEAQTRAHLLHRVLPDIDRQAPIRKVVLMTGAAPGIDLVFNRTASEWFQRCGIECASVALLPVPPQWLFRDWLLRAEADGQTLGDGARERCLDAINKLLADAQSRVLLYDPAEPDLDALAASSKWRTEQYRALAACLAEQSDVLVAVLRAQKLGEPGGTAEVVEWRRHPQRIPTRFSTLADAASERARHHPLIVIDPGVAFVEAAAERGNGSADGQAEALLAQAEAAMRDGNDLRCHDLLSRALKRGLRSRRMEYLRILALANVGGTRLAMEHYRSLVLLPQELDEDWLALHGRLEKDLGLANSGDEAVAHFLRAAEAYADSFRRWHGPYSGINAATMLLMAGRPAPARELAQQVQERLAELQPERELEQFFHLVSGAEAALHLGNQTLCRERLAQANQRCVNDVVRRGRTLQQLRRLCRKLQVDPALLEPLRMPPLMLLRRRPDSGAGVDDEAALELRIEADIPRGALVFMPLLDRVDLAIAALLLERGVHLYPTLSQPAAEARASWNAQWGEATAQRLGEVLARAQRVAIVPGFLDDEVPWRAHQLACTALGASLQTALRLGCEWRSAWIERRQTRVFCRPGQVGEYVEGPVPAAGRRMVGVLFADFVGFGRIADTDMPRFWREIMGTMSTRLGHYGRKVLHSATWGDALHVVTCDATTAAEIAADILSALEAQRRQRGVAAQLELRVAAHYAPAFEDVDALRGTPVFYGSQISFAARIEPVTPPGTVFGSDAFVAQLMLESPERFSAEYAGELELAKKFGAHPLFAVHRRAVG
ncbi:TRAFs-binding domain-containing protein [Hydrocarboniphaga sp.]|uniref:TRAFs-binding domain-containing protein n=1 Tax=Hydrocarboniphaga sp. TaxID=2033016 RepID=UPI003D118F85